MVKEFEGVTPPNNDAILWRYMSLEKFANLLDRKSLFFTRADKFDDTFEGHVPRQIMSIYRSAVSAYEREHFGELSQSPILESVRDLREYVMCSCWHQGEHESMAMWDKYHIRNSGIVIKTTLENLKNSLPDKPDVFIGEMQYLDDHNKIDVLKSVSVMNLMHQPYFYKRKPFEYEREVRLIIDFISLVEYMMDLGISDITQFSDLGEMGMPLKIDVDTLINKNDKNSEIIISPYADEWVRDTVASIVKQYGFQFPVNRSRLLDTPGQELKYIQEEYEISDEIMRYWETKYGPGEKPKFETEQDWELWRKAFDAFLQLSKKDQYFIMSYWSHPDYL